MRPNKPAPTLWRLLVGERSEHPSLLNYPNFRHIYNIYIYIYLFIFIFQAARRARAVNALRANVRRTGRLRFKGQYNRLENGYFSSKL